MDCCSCAGMRKHAVLRAFLTKDSEKALVRVTRKEQPGSLPIVTEYTVLEPGLCARVEILLHTGRTHQIRAQMAAIGHPLLGDGKYGRARENKKYGRTGGQALCSYQLAFRFTTDAGCLAGLNGRVWTVDQVDFVTDYFPHVPLHP